MGIAVIMPSGEITQLLQAWRGGDEQALQKLTPMVYAELRRLARSYMSRERPGHTLETTALVHEAYTKLVCTPHIDWRDRGHFYAVCAQLMRRVLVDYARSRNYLKRGGGIKLVPLEEARDIGQDGAIDFLILDEALNRLSAFDPRKGQVVELRFFGGLSVEETADVLELSTDTVRRDWKMAKVWLLREMDAQQPPTTRTGGPAYLREPR